MSYSAALTTALKKAAYFKTKHYVWGFQSRNGKWYYTVTDYQPAFMMHLESIT